MDSTQRFRRNDLAKWLRKQIRSGGWNSEVYDVDLNKVVGDGTPVLTVVFKDNKRLRITVEVVKE